MKMSKKKVPPVLNKYIVMRDKQEKANYWEFGPDDYCEKTIAESLDDGDYTLVGFEKTFSIERKANTGEFAKNVTEGRFERELDRLDKLPHSFLLLDFSLDDIYRFPYNSGIPKYLWPKLRVGSNFILKRLIEIQTTHRCQVILTNGKGKDIAKLIFKRMIEMYPDHEKIKTCAGGN